MWKKPILVKRSRLGTSGRIREETFNKAILTSATGLARPRKTSSGPDQWSGHDEAHLDHWAHVLGVSDLLARARQEIASP